METTDNSATSSPAPSAARRSGRATKIPEKFVPSPMVAYKRKRAAAHDDEDAENEPPEDDAAPSDVDADESAAEETTRRKKKPSASQTAKPRKPAAKKPKINGNAPALANHTSKLPSRPKKTVRIDVSRHEGDDLFAEIFGSGRSSDKVATDWYHNFQEDSALAVTNLVNCVLRAAGCDQQVTLDDIKDIDNCQNRLADLQNVYTEEGITDYPLISRSKTTKPFRELLMSFFKSLINILHETEVLYKDTTLMDNIARWVASMSSSTLRPFRHTATTVALTMEAALVEVSKKLDERITKMTQQFEAERSRKGKNKNDERVLAVKKTLQEATHNSNICQEIITDFFDTVFVHRYRDVDPKIRTECVEALGTWILVLPTMFMKPEYLRYLGWMLSDTVPQIRHEVLKQLFKIFKKDAEKVGHFIDRFRPRLVEMATQDSDVGVRVAAIDVIEILKESGNLEPLEIDTIGKLIYDAEPRIRKAVVNFFVDSVKDSIESKIADLGGSEVIDELFGDEDDEDYSSPRRDWIDVKALVEILASYDEQLEDEQQSNHPRGLEVAVETIDAVAAVTRISLASEVLYEKLDYINNWEVLSGYLLYDHTQSSKPTSQSDQNSNEAAVRNAVAPEGLEETILLQVFSSAVKLSLKSAPEADKSKKKSRVDSVEDLENIALRLAGAIPRLLRKFGADPSTAVAVLQLEHFLDLDKMQHLRQDSTAYSRLLDEVCTQFDRHMDRGVIAECTAALLHARQYDELEEMTDGKITLLLENVINSLRNFDKLCELSIRGNLDREAITELGNVLMKMSRLAAIMPCTDALEAEGQTEDSLSPVSDILVRIVGRGKIAEVDEELDDPEDEAVSFAIKCCELYFLWKVRSLIDTIQNQADIAGREVHRLNSLRQKYAENLLNTLASRGNNDELRLFATGALCRVHFLFASVRQAIEATVDGPQKYAVLEPLLAEMPSHIIDELIEVFTAAESAYAKRAKKTRLDPADDEDPMDDEEMDSDEEDEASLTPEERKGRELKAEKILCDLTSNLVKAVLARMVDCTGPKPGKLKKRILRNQNKLGPNFKEIVLHLDETRQLREKNIANRKKATAKKDKGKEPAASVKKPISEAIIVNDDSSELSLNPFEDSEPEEGTYEDLRRRELLDDPIEEDGEPQEDNGGPSNWWGADGNDAGDDDSVLGD